MTQQEYESKKRECYDEYECPRHSKNPAKDAFSYAFDRAYALGKQTETTSQEEIEKASMKYRDAHYDKFYDNLHDDSRTWDALEHVIIASFISGAQFALGKQEKDADTMLSGWVARDANPHSIYVYGHKPLRLSDMWSTLGMSFATQIDPTLFPDLTWSDEPQECEIIIKRKKKIENQ